MGAPRFAWRFPDHPHTSHGRQKPHRSAALTPLHPSNADRCRIAPSAVELRTVKPPARFRSAGFQTCCIADFQVGGASWQQEAAGAFGRPAGLETRDTADLAVCATQTPDSEVCATSVAPARRWVFRGSRPIPPPHPARCQPAQQKLQSSGTGAHAASLPMFLQSPQRLDAPDSRNGCAWFDDQAASQRLDENRNDPLQRNCKSRQGTSGVGLPALTATFDGAADGEARHRVGNAHLAVTSCPRR